jgi:signal transduction histidine kinase
MPDESAQLFANASQLRLALDNLVRNAADALGPTAQANKTVTVDIRQHDTVVRVEVRDSGPGVAPDVLPRVLDEASLYTSKPSRGSGFGLRFVRRTLRQHGGQLELQNLNGQGFSATMVLPLFRPGGS